MIARYRVEKTVRDLRFHFDFHWDELGRLVRIGLNEDCVTPEVDQPPYGIAAVVRELHAFLKEGDPLLPLHWSLLCTDGLTEFARKVYEATLTIPHGETRTYAWIAKRVGKPLAGRAVGQALRRNPFPILIPCHRVVADKSLGGFMGSDQAGDFELRFKSWLLDLERGYRNPSFPFLTSLPAI